MWVDIRCLYSQVKVGILPLLLDNDYKYTNQLTLISIDNRKLRFHTNIGMERHHLFLGFEIRRK